MPKKILIVDDSKIERNILCSFLKDKYDIIEAENGEEALSVLQQCDKGVSAILLDILMPEMNGYEVLKRIYKNPEWRNVPVIVTTGLTDVDSQVKAMSLGANGYIVKPYNRNLIIYTLENTINLYEKSEMLNTFRKDELTGILNRMSFMEAADKMIREKEPGYYILSCLDIENFKVINDQYGIVIGDRVLQYMAEMIEKCITSIGGICCRFTADRFGIIYPAEHKNSDMFSEAQKKMTEPPFINSKIRIRVGRYPVKDLSLSVSAMFDRATLAEESIKGRYDTYIEEYSDSMRTTLLSKQQIVNNMHGALTSGQFEPWFQPQYNHATGALIGAEALVRWKYDGVYIPPSKFIPIFENNGFIYEMDQYIWEEVCKLMRKWIDEGYDPLPVSINISRRDLFHAHFIKVLTGIIKKYSLPYDLIRIEVTESAFAESSRQIIEKVNKLIELGFTVEIDDFGSGYSSLNTLKDVPASILKLDMRFFENTENSQRAGNIIESVVRMAKWLGMAVIAEGVEEKEQADYLKSIGCYYIQGYYYAKPMPEDEYAKLLKVGNKEVELTRLKTVKSLDNSEFWNPKSMDTLIFNSYVGGACIFEYRDGKTELLRVNEQYLRELGKLVPNDAKLSEKSPVKYLDEENINILRETIINAIAEEKEHSCELKLSDEVTGYTEYIMATIKLIAQASERYLFYCVIVNVTEQRIAEQKEHNLSIQMQTIMSNINGGITATVFHDKDNVEVIFSNDQFYKMYGYTREQMEAESPNVLDMIYPEDREKTMQTVERIVRERGSEMYEYRCYKRDGSIIWIQCSNSVISIEGSGDTVLLAVTSDITELRNMQREILETSDKLKAVMKSAGSGITATALYDTGAEFLFVNDKYYEILGYTKESYEKKLSKDLFAPLYSEDRERMISLVKGMTDINQSATVQYRVLRADGEVIWVRAVITLTKLMGIDAPVQIAVFTDVNDIAEQFKIKEKQRALLDNLPCGAGLYDFDGKRVNVVYVNKVYQKMVGRDVNGGKNISVLNVVHPYDLSRIKKKISDAGEEGKNHEPCNVRIRHADGTYHPYHIDSRYIARGDGRWSSCITFLPIPEEQMSMQQMMPYIFPAIMESSTDITFAKDQDFRYLCCSRAYAQLLGLNSERDVIGKTDYELFPKDIADKLRNDEKKLISSKKPMIDVMETIPTGEGLPYYSRTSRYLLSDTEGNILGIYGIGRDITASHEADSQLKLLTDTIPGGLATYACTKKKVGLAFCNDGFCNLFGYTREELAKQGKAAPIEFIFEEDREKIQAEMDTMLKGAKTADCIYRIHTKGGGYKWISHHATVADKVKGVLIVNAILMDITEQQEEKEYLRRREEEYRLATRHSSITICRYNIAEQTLKLEENEATRLVLPEYIKEVPYGRVKLGKISADTADAYIRFYEGIMNGESDETVIFKKLLPNGWRWIKANATTIFSDSGKPVSAVISYVDITEQQEKEAVYIKWQQALQKRNPDLYTLFRCNLNKEDFCDAQEGRLLKCCADGDAVMPFNENVKNFAEQYVYEEDWGRYISFLDSDKMLASYYRGIRYDEIEFRAKMQSGEYHWLRLSVELVEYPNSTDIQAYLMYEDINDSKLEELQTKMRAETDSLTGLLNRHSFEEKMNCIQAHKKEGTVSALFLIDMDGFKRVNDKFGHLVGDTLLINTGKLITSEVNKGDLICRLGGDEFLVYLSDAKNNEEISEKAKKICSLLERNLDNDVYLSISLGVAISPDNGNKFKELYNKADKALYYVKEHGKAGYAVYSDDMKQRC